MTPALIDARTVHVRLAPFERRFEHRFLQVLIDIDAPPRRLLFGRNRFNLFSFHARDHGRGDGAPLRAFVEAAFARAGVALEGGRVWLLAQPRVLGFTFNPLSVYFGYGPGGDLRGVLYEVSNTFGERHHYAAAATREHGADKALFVSPFWERAGAYRFKLRPPGERISLTIANHKAGERQHIATLRGHAGPLTSWTLLKAFLTRPLAPLHAIAAIHWHALMLWRRGAQIFTRPKAFAEAVTVCTPAP